MDHLKHLLALAGTIDSHCHLTVTAGRGVPLRDILTRCFDAGMRALLDIGINAWDLPQRLEAATGFPHVVHSAGVHPAEAERVTVDTALHSIRNAVANPAVVAIGETGLDCFRGRDHAAAQYALFEAQLHAAHEFDLPLIIHNRDATEDILRVLHDCPPPRGGIMHCFSAAPGYVDKCVDLGFYVSFAGNLTFANAEQLRLAAARVPLDALLVETDAPFLAPLPARGRPNHPGYIAHTYGALAAIRQQPLDRLICAVAENFARLFPTAPLAPRQER